MTQIWQEKEKREFLFQNFSFSNVKICSRKADSFLLFRRKNKTAFFDKNSFFQNFTIFYL
jgi:hypothetical protein